MLCGSVLGDRQLGPTATDLDPHTLSATLGAKFDVEFMAVNRPADSIAHPTGRRRKYHTSTTRRPPSIASPWLPRTRQSRLGRPGGDPWPCHPTLCTTLPRRVLVLPGLRALAGPRATVLAALDPRGFVPRRAAVTVVLHTGRNDVPPETLGDQDCFVVVLPCVSRSRRTVSCTGTISVELDTDQISHHHRVQVLLLGC